MSRATIIAKVDSPEGIAARVHIWDVEGSDEAVAVLPPRIVIHID